MNLQFEKDLQAIADEGNKEKLAKENETLRAQIQKMKVAVETPAHSAKDTKLIDGLRWKVDDYSFDMNKKEKELARAQKQLVENAANLILNYFCNSPN